MKKYIATNYVLLFMPLFVLAANFTLPAGDAWTWDTISTLVVKIADNLIAIGLVGAIISFVASGILYFTSGFNSKSVDKAKELFKFSLIGTLIVLAVGVIINTIQVIVSGKFFG